MRTFKKGLTFFLLALPFLISLLISIYLKKMLKELPSSEKLREYAPMLSTKIFDRNRKLIKEIYIERRDWVKLSSIPSSLKKAILAIEDHNFYKHWGISYRGIIRAIRDNIIKRKIVAGGSTITQQLARLAFLNLKRTLSRKIKEFFLTLQFESNFSKDEIFEMYLNQVYFGEGAYGVRQASRRYFNKEVEELNLSESAMLAGLIRFPNYYSPFKNFKRAVQRRNVILKRMMDINYISPKEMYEAMSQELCISTEVVVERIAPYFIEHVKMYLEKKYGGDMVYGGGLSVYTTLDLDLQKSAEAALINGLNRIDKKIYKLTGSTEKVNGAILATDVKTGGILVMVGGRDFLKSQFNRAIHALRQLGSAFKPILYLSAIENGYKLSSILDDTPLVYKNDGRNWRLVSRTTDYLLQLPPDVREDPMKIWTPSNYKNRYYGRVTLRKALEYSLNSCSVQLIDALGPAKVISYARKLGIKSPLINTYALALGASECTLEEIVTAYRVFANCGIRVKTNFIIKVVDKNGNLLERRKIIEKEVISPQTAYLMTSLLRGVVLRGTARSLKWLGKAVAGKTGTTSEFMDAWFIGYSTDIVCGVWVGYDKKKSLGPGMSGAVVACPIWMNFMRDALRDRKFEEFRSPSDEIIYAYINPKDGLLTDDISNGYWEVFLSGTEPKQFSTTQSFEVATSTANEMEHESKDIPSETP